MLNSPTISRARRLGPVAAAVFGGLASVGLFFAFSHFQRGANQAALDAAAGQRMEVLRESLDSSLEALHSLGSLYDSGAAVDRQLFRRFSNDAFARHPELQALSWTPKVASADRDLWEATARKEGLSGFQFTAQDALTGAMTRAPLRSSAYYPVFFIEPLATNQAALGFDLNARLETLDRARREGNAVSTPFVHLMQSAGNEPGFIVYLPLYQGGRVPPDEPSRRDYNVGFVAAVFKIPALVKPALAQQRGLQVIIRDTVGASPISYAAPSSDHSPLIDSLVPRTFSLPVGGRSWDVTFMPTAAFLEGRERWQPWVALGVGFALTLLLAGFLQADLRRDLAEARANASLVAEIAERKRAEEAASAATRAKSEFLTSLSHEIRTPLNAILGYTHLFERDPDLPARHRDAVDALGNSGRHLLGLLNSILDLAKIEAGKMEIQNAAFDLPALVRGLAEMFNQPCREKRIGLRVVCPPGASPAVFGDEGKLRQVLINLLGNAVKFTPLGEVYLSAQPLELNRWRFEVIDTGIGIDPADQEHLGRPFQQTPAGRSHGGTGLGLAIARRHVELLGGHLEMSSEPGLGTRFWFEIPLPDAVSQVALAPSSARLPPGTLVRALVVDDNRDNRIILRRLLTDIGCVVAEAATAAAAQDIVRQAPPDIVFADIFLAETTGPLFVEAMVKEGLLTEAVIVFQTAAFLDQTQTEALRRSGALRLPKPFRVDDLCSCLGTVKGVHFEEGSAPSVLQSDLPEWELIVLPAELCERMVMAAELHSTTVLKACVEELRQRGGPASAFAERLRLLLRSYDLAGISRLLNRVRVEPAIPA